MLWYLIIMGLIALTIAICMVHVKTDFFRKWPNVPLYTTTFLLGISLMIFIYATIFWVISISDNSEELIGMKYNKLYIEQQYEERKEYPLGFVNDYNEKIEIERMKLKSPWLNIYANKSVANLEMINIGGEK